MKKSVLLGLAMLLAQSLPAFAGSNYGLPEKIQDGNILHCFDWTFNDIKSMLPQIAEAGFGAVQVSPVQGNAATNAEWYYAYMPYDFVFKPNGNGSRAQLQALCNEAANYGIKIIVDVVANHVNKVQSYHDSWWDSNGRIRWEGGIDYGNRYSITHGQLGDYGDVNSEASDVQQRAKAFVEDLKSIGVKGIRWDAAKHIGLPSEGCNFWSVVTSVPGIYHYGEILDGPGGNANSVMREYTNYMSVTDNGYCNQVRNAVCSSSVPGNAGGWAAGTIAENKVVYWGESHDDYSNEWTATTFIPQDKIDRSWAICSCRAGASGLYFSRPSGTSRNAIKMGQKGSTHFTSKEIAAINHLRNAAVGTADYYTGEGGVACITRQGVGAAIVVGGGGARQVTVKNGGGYVPAGTYTDEVSGNQFIVTSTTISGQVGSTGIAVIYGAVVKTPVVTFSPDGGSFRSETLTVTATLTNAVSGWYKIDGGQKTNISGMTTFTIGQGVAAGSKINVEWGATGEDGTNKTGTVTFTKVDPNAGVYVYYNNPRNWNNVSAYIYSETAGEACAWPGLPMTKDGAYWSVQVPDAFTMGGMVIFNNGGAGEQYPASMEPGLPINGTSMICLDNSTWKVYEGNTSPDPNPDPNPNPTGHYVYLKNTNGWHTPTVWAWNDTQNNVTNSQGWPGDVMESLGNDLWKWNAREDAIPTKIIFSDSGNNQTADLNYVNGATYDCSGNVIEQGNPNPDPNPNPNPDPDPNPNPDPDPNPGPFTPGQNLQTDYFKVNPNGKVGSNRTVNVASQSQGSNALNNWTEADLIAQGVARDICQAFRGTHERPIVDSYALYAAYDAQNLYLGVQYVYTVWDEWGEGFQGGESKPYNMDGDLTIAFDLDPAKSCDGTLVNGNSVWKDAKYTTFDNGMDCLWKGSTKPGVGTPGLFFPNAQGKMDYNNPASCKKSNVTYNYADGLLPSIQHIYGQGSFGYDPALLEGNEGFVDLIPEVSRLGGKSTAHTFYEYKFPLSDLGISESYIKNNGIGVMIVDMYGASAHSCLPYDPSMFDNVMKPYSMDESSSAEKEDVDVVTYGFARIGKLAAGIDNVTVTSSVKISATMGAIMVSGCEGKNLTVASIDGRLISNGVVRAEQACVHVAPGIYIVRCGDRTAKVLVR